MVATVRRQPFGDATRERRDQTPRRVGPSSSSSSSSSLFFLLRETVFSVSSNPSSSSPPGRSSAPPGTAPSSPPLSPPASPPRTPPPAPLSSERLAGVAGGAQICVLAVQGLERHPASATASVAHSLAGVALGLVLVFRTNSSFARLTEARVLLGNMVRCARDLARLAVYVQGDSDDGARARTVVVGYAASIGSRSRRTCGEVERARFGRSHGVFRVDPRTQLERVVGAETADAYVSRGAASHARRHEPGAQGRARVRMPRGPHHQAEELVSEMGKIVGGRRDTKHTDRHIVHVTRRGR